MHECLGFELGSTLQTSLIWAPRSLFRSRANLLSALTIKRSGLLHLLFACDVSFAAEQGLCPQSYRFLAPPPHLLVLGSTERTLSAVCSIVHTETKVSTYVATQQIADSIGTSSKLFSHRIYAKNPFVPATEKTAKTAMSAITLGVNDVDDADFEGRKYYGSVMTTVSKPAKRKAPAKLSECKHAS